jgi:glucosamine-6-phosphate deaminase
MRVIIEKNYDTLSLLAASYIMNRINNCTKDFFVLGLPTGSTPLGTYKYLIKFYNEGLLSFKKVITFNMDEYVGLEPSHKQSYNYFMHQNFFNYIDIPKYNINLLDGMAHDLTEVCNKYEKKIKAYGGIDLFLCGIGADGHIAFNEPGSSLNSETRLKTLCEETISDNSRFFDNLDDVPKQALTVGIKTIYDAREIIIIANGLKKSKAIRECIEGCISNQYTCTIAQSHKKALILVDEKATYELKVKSYFYYKNLQKNLDLFGNPIKNMLKSLIFNDDKILITSPHPDDDIIGCGGIMQLFPNKKNVDICYMTNGSGGIKGNNNKHTSIRIKEAISAIKVLGYNKDQILTPKLPFYYKNTREITEEDTLEFNKVLDNYNSSMHLFICYDSDPKGTHDKCLQIIKNSNLKKIKYIWLYKSAWGEWEKNENTIDIHLDEVLMKNKLLSMDMHITQEIPVVTNKNVNSFKDVIIKNAHSNNHPNKFTERFKVLTIDEFKKL